MNKTSKRNFILTLIILLLIMVYFIFISKEKYVFIGNYTRDGSKIVWGNTYFVKEIDKLGYSNSIVNSEGFGTILTLSKFQLYQVTHIKNFKKYIDKYDSEKDAESKNSGIINPEPVM